MRIEAVGVSWISFKTADGKSRSSVRVVAKLVGCELGYWLDFEGRVVSKYLSPPVKLKCDFHLPSRRTFFDLDFYRTHINDFAVEELFWFLGAVSRTLVSESALDYILKHFGIERADRTTADINKLFDFSRAGDVALAIATFRRPFEPLLEDDPEASFRAIYFDLPEPNREHILEELIAEAKARRKEAISR